MTENSLLHILALQHVPNIGDITAKKLISHCGSVEAVFNEKKHNLTPSNRLNQYVYNGLSAVQNSVFKIRK